MAAQPRIRGPTRGLGSGGDVLEGVEQTADVPKLACVAEREGLAGHDVAGEQVVAVLEELLQEADGLRITIPVINQQGRIEDVPHAQSVSSERRSFAHAVT